MPGRSGRRGVSAAQVPARRAPLRRAARATRAGPKAAGAGAGPGVPKAGGPGTAALVAAVADGPAGRGGVVRLKAADAVFAVLCFEGPDPYSLAGGLGSRIAGLTAALATAGAQTHLYFVGDPALADVERRCDDRLVLHRWSQWVSRYYPAGVYHGENEKLYDYNETVPGNLLEAVARPAAAAGKRLFVLGEDWHTAEALSRVSDALWHAGLRDGATLVWNANNPMGFERINWGRLGFTANLTTVSRYMKHSMWSLGQNPTVIPNGIPETLLAAPDPLAVADVRSALQTTPEAPVFVKVARWDPDKRWVMAVHAVAALRRAGVAARLVAKGGVEAHQAEVFELAGRLGLRVADADVPSQASVAGLSQALAGARDADIINVRGFLPAGLLQVLYRAADAVLANSGMEPFGLVGLEAMAAGAIVFTGATGEDYARPLQNAVVLETDDAGEIARYWLQLQGEDTVAARLRAGAVATAREYAWPAVVDILLHRMDYLATASSR